MSRYGGYRGGKPASEMGPPAEVPSAFWHNAEQEARKAFSMYGIDEENFKRAALYVAIAPDNATPEEIVNAVLAGIAGKIYLIQPIKINASDSIDQND